MRSLFAGRLRLVALVAGAVLVLIGVSVFVATESTRRIAQESQRLHELSEVQRLIDAQIADVGLMVHLSALVDQLEWELGDEIDVLGESVMARNDELGARAEPFDVYEVDVTIVTSTQLVELTGAGDATEAQRLLDDHFSTDAAVAADRISELRFASLAEVADADAVSARVGDMARLVVLLLVPMAIVVVYRVLSDRQLRQRQLELQHEAEAALAEAREEFVAATARANAGAGATARSVELPDEVMSRLRRLTGEIDDLPAILDDLGGASAIAVGRTEARRTVGTSAEADAIVRPFVREGAVIDRQVEPAIVEAPVHAVRLVLRSAIGAATAAGAPRIVLDGQVVDGAFHWSLVHGTESRAVPTAAPELGDTTPKADTFDERVADAIAAAHDLEVVRTADARGRRTVVVVPVATTRHDVPPPPRSDRAPEARDVETGVGMGGP